MKNQKKKFITFLAVCLLLLNLSMSYTQGQIIGEQTEKMLYANPGEFLPETIAILYDPINPNTEETARAIFETISYLYSNVRLVKIYSPLMFKQSFDEDYWIRIYVFDTNLDGLQLGGWELKWKDLAWYFNFFEKSHHIAVFGNSYNVKDIVVNNKCYFEEKEVVDVRTGYLHAIWSVSEIFLNKKGDLYKQLGDNFQKVAIQYFTDNFESLVAAEFDPQYTLGEEDPEKVKERLEKFKKEHPETLYKIHPETGEKLDVTEDIPDFNPVMEIKPKLDAEEDDDIILSDFPFLSSIAGAAGDVIKIILEFIGAEIPDGVVTVGRDFANSIKDIVNEIPKIIGIIKDPSASSAMELFFDVLKSAFPSLEEYKPYFDIATKALFAIRDGPAGILSLLDDLLVFLIPESAQSFVGNITAALNLTTEFWDGMMNTDNWADYLMKHLNRQLIYQIMWKVGELIGGSFDVQETAETVTEMFIVGIEIISTKNYTALVRDVIPYLGARLFGSSVDEDTLTLLKGLGVLLEMGLGAAGVMEIDFDESAQHLFEIFFPDVDFTLAAGKAAIDTLLETVKGVVELTQADYATVLSQITSAVTSINTLSSAGLSAGQITVISEGIALVMKVLQNGFNVPADINLVDLVSEFINNFIPSMNAGKKDLVKKTIELASSLVAFVTNKDSIKIYIKGSVDNFLQEVAENPGELVKNVLTTILPILTGESANSTMFNIVGNIVEQVINLLKDGFDFSVQNILQTVVSIAGMALSLLDIDIPIEVVENIFNLFWSDKPEFKNTQDIVNTILQVLDPIISPEIKSIINTVLTFLGSAKQLFKDGLRWIMNQVVGFVGGKIADLLNMLTNKLNDLITNLGDFLSYEGTFDIGFGSFSLFALKIFFSLSPGFSINKEVVIELVNDLVFHSSKLLDTDNLGRFFLKILKAISIIPIFKAGLEVNSGTSGKNSLVNMLLSSLGIELGFSGSAGLTLQLFKIANGKVSMSDFFKIIEFFFKFEVSISKTFPLAEFFFGPAVSVLAKVAEFLGLGGIYLKITFWISVEIVKRIETEFQKAADILTIVIGIGVQIIIELSLVIVGITIIFGFTVTLSFIQDFLADSPMQVVLEIIFIVSVKLVFLLWDWTGEVEFGPDPIYLAGGKDDPETADEMSGIDADGDGLPDTYEEMIPGLKIDSDDSDGDGLTDKYEIKTSGTDPILADSDEDGLEDGYEIQVSLTNPLQVDSDFDGLTDYDEVVILGTDPNNIDTDGDSLDDYYEVNTAWNMANITRSVAFVTIGGVDYIDHTDPLNPDTDGDGLLDGQEGEFGAYYGPDLYDDEDDTYYPDQPPIICGRGYIHPLDNDTDDDSYRQLCNGSIAPGRMFLIPMTDKIEIEGQWVVFIEDDELIPKLVRTNPVNPDSDGDTGILNPTWRTDAAPLNIFLISDGYELWLDPPTDPNDADTDDDGLIDGFEGYARPDGNHTDPRNYDTDNDGLGDLQDILLGSDPLDPDSDHDGVLDGEEYFVFGTNPAYEDTDFDGLLDGEELYLYHTNPLAPDSDGDGIEDGLEVLFYDTNPMDEDEDNDGLTDWEELFVHETLPRVYDSDNDGLSDWEEVAIYYTHPLKWDTDNDSIWYPNEFGEMTFPMSDGDEVKLYGTNPLSSDTDVDGIYDCLELYIGSGLIPDFEPIPLNPLSNDTDSDGLLDSQEYLIENVTDIVFPYRSFLITTPFNTSAVNPDTDADGLLDGEEIFVYGTLPYSNDTDGDGILDSTELFATNTNPLTFDTDGDAVSDYDELFIYTGLMDLDPNNPDTDGDWLPDGAELDPIYTDFYDIDPWTYNSINVDGTPTPIGLYVDNDFDGLEDGHEFFTYFTPLIGGGVTQPDSDHDGLADGMEVYQYGTNCTLWDTDADTFSDGLEVMIGTNPLEETTWEEYLAAMEAFVRGIVVVSPVNGATYYPSNYTFILYNASQVNSVTYQLRETSDVFVENISMDFDQKSHSWIKYGEFLDTGDYEVQFFVSFPDGNVTKVTRVFYVEAVEGTVKMTWVYVGLGGGLAVGTAAPATFYLARAGKLDWIRRLFGGGKV